MPYKNTADKKANDRKNYQRRRKLRIDRERARQLKDPVGYKARMRAYYQTAGRDQNYRNLYGIGLADYDLMLRRQSGCCAICGADKPSPKRQNFAVDHDHVTDRVRGLLCIRCNSHLGWFEKFYEPAMIYLGSTSKEKTA